MHMPEFFNASVHAFIFHRLTDGLPAEFLWEKTGVSNLETLAANESLADYSFWNLDLKRDAYFHRIADLVSTTLNRHLQIDTARLPVGYDQLDVRWTVQRVYANGQEPVKQHDGSWHLDQYVSQAHAVVCLKLASECHTSCPRVLLDPSARLSGTMSSPSPNHWTFLYYVNPGWQPAWGGETMFRSELFVRNVIWFARVDTHT